MRFSVRASVGNSDGVFDAAYDFGDSVGDQGGMVATPEEIGAEVTRYLKSLDKADMDAMRYGTAHFFVELIIEPAMQAGLDPTQLEAMLNGNQG